MHTMHRASTRVAYRRLLKSCSMACATCHVDEEGLRRYVSRRFIEVARSTAGSVRIDERIDDALRIADCFDASRGNAELASLLQVLAAGVGNEPMSRYVEKGFFDLVQHRQMKETRREADDESSSDRQNQLLQQAVAPYAARLKDLTERVGAPLRSCVSTHLVDHGMERLVVDVDDELNKQVLYVVAEDGLDTHANVEDVEVVQPDELRKMTIHSEFFSAALRLLESAMKETPLHRSRNTVVVGYQRGGAIGVALALLLNAHDFDVRNTLTLGSPKCVVTCPERAVVGITPVRIVVAGDPAVDAPVASSEGSAFVHLGEVLVMEAAPSDEPTMEGRRGLYTLASYAALLQSQTTALSYAESEDDMWDEGPHAASEKKWKEDDAVHFTKSWKQSIAVPE